MCSSAHERSCIQSERQTGRQAGRQAGRDRDRDRETHIETETERRTSRGGPKHKLGTASGENVIREEEG